MKPSFWKSETLAAAPKEARLLAVALLNYADDLGFFAANAALIRGECFPFDEDSSNVLRGLDDLSRVGFLVLGKSDDEQRVGLILNFRDHQKIDRPTRPNIAGKSITWDDGVDRSTIIRRWLDEFSSLEEEGKRKGKWKGGSKRALPEAFSISDRVRKWASENGHTALDRHLEAFVSKARAKGYTYADWDEALMNAIRDNWAKVPVVVSRRDDSAGVV